MIDRLTGTVPVPVIVGERVAGEAVAARKELLRLVSFQQKSGFDIGELLHRIKKNGWYDGWDTFQEFVDSVPNLKPRKAMYMRRIAEVMESVSITREVYEEVDVSSLRHITSLGGNPYNPEAVWVNPETKAETPIKSCILALMDMAKTLPVKEIAQHVRTLKGFIGDNDLVYRNFCVTRKVNEEVVEPAMELIRRHIGTVGRDEEGMAKDASDGACLEAAMAEILSDPGYNVSEEP